MSRITQHKPFDYTDCEALPSLRSDLPEWAALEKRADKMRHQSISNLFATDAQRFENFSLHYDSILMDFSKQCLD
ncbi:MAG: hypothetical protein KAJ40_06295, partial [Alphaproteobacteria bacterium]|nr:hypothetical protein [Alphaproteobacteria bacterium]